MKLPKKIAALLTVTLVASSAGNLSFADTVQGASSEELKGAGRWETAIEISKNGWSSATEAVIVNDASIADALAATPFADAKNAPILLTGKDSLNEKTKAELKRLGVKKVYIIGGENTLTKNVENLLKAEKLEVERIYGNTRELTALEIAKKLDEIKPISEIAVVNSTKGLPDAVSIAAAAADKDMAIILSNTNEGTKASDEFIKSKDIKTSYVIGGVNSVSEDVKNKLPNAKRIDGKDRNETNAKVLKYFYTETEINNAYVAKDGMGKEDQLIDALSVGVLAAKNDSPVIIVGNKLNEMQKDVTNTKSFKTVTQVGGNGNEAAFNELKTMQGVTTYEVKTVAELNEALAKANANDVINVRSLNDNSRNQNTEIKSENAITINIDSTSEKTLSIDIKNGTVKIYENQTVIYMESGELVIEGKISTVNVAEGGDVTIINESTSKPNVTVAEGASVEVDGKFNNITVNGKDAVVSVEKDSTVSKIEVSKDASGTVIENAGKVDKVTSNAPNVSVDNSGTVGTVSGTGSNKPTVDNSGGGVITQPSTGGGGGGYTPPADTTAPTLATTNAITVKFNDEVIVNNGETLIIDGNQDLATIQMSENIYINGNESGIIEYRYITSDGTWSEYSNYGTFTVKEKLLNIVKDANVSSEGKCEYKIAANMLKDAAGNKNNEIIFDISSYSSLIEAIENIKSNGEASEIIIVCKDITYNIDGNNAGELAILTSSIKDQNLTIKSKDSNSPVTLTFEGGGTDTVKAARNGKLIFENIKIDDISIPYDPDAWEFSNLEMGGNLSFENVIFESGIMLESQEANFKKCTFTNNINAGRYAAWVSNGKATFEDCIFNSPRSIKVHQDYGSKIKEVIVDNCTFTGLYKPAVVIGNLVNCPHTTPQGGKYPNKYIVSQDHVCSENTKCGEKYKVKVSIKNCNINKDASTEDTYYQQGIFESDTPKDYFKLDIENNTPNVDADEDTPNVDIQ